MTNLLEALRAGTRSMHTELHRHPSMEKITTGALTLSEYRHMLLAFYSPWKQLLPAMHLFHLPSLQQCLQTRASALAEDLLALGVVLDQKEAPSPALSSGGLWGGVYVMVGASLGATQLSRQIAMVLPKAPLAYFSMAPIAAGWPILKDHLMQMDASEHSDEVAFAQATFKAIEAELSKPLEVV